MPKSATARKSALSYPLGSLYAMADIMLVLFVTTLLAGVAAHVEMSEDPLPAGKDTPASMDCDHIVIVGPGTGVSLNGRPTTVDHAVEVLRGHPEAKVHLRAAPNVDATLFFTCRYRLREAGIGYVERPPEGNGNSNTPNGGTR